MPSHNAVFAVDSVLCVFRSVVCDEALPKYPLKQT